MTAISTKAKDPTEEEVAELLSYLDWDASENNFRWSNKEGNKCKGKLAGSRRNLYIQICIKGSFWLAQRLAWVIHHGSYPAPSLTVDHIDRNPHNNSKENLRLVSQAVNCRNQNRSKNNTSGVNGVFKAQHRKGNWSASIMVDRKNLWIGSFDTLRGAELARKFMETGLEFHRTHGSKALGCMDSN
jgi:hypothetical protein